MSSIIELGEKVCRQCGLSKDIEACYSKSAHHKSGYHSLCKECLNGRTKGWRDGNPEAVAESAKKSGAKRVGKRNEYNREWKRLNADRVKTYKAEYDIQNPNQKRACGRRNYRKYRERRIEIVKAYAKNNPDKVRSYSHANRSKRRLVAGKWTARQWRDLCRAYGGVCLCCGEMNPLCVDHIIPITKPGTSNMIDNLQPLCKSCNSSKSNKTIDYRPDKSCLLRIDGEPDVPTLTKLGDVGQ